MIGRGRDRAAVRRDELTAELTRLLLAQGFLHLSLEDLAREAKCSKSTLYQVAESKEQIMVAVVRAFFRGAAERIERRMQSVAVRDRIGAYLIAISDELAPASPEFFADLYRFAPTREIYIENTRIASERLQEFVLAAAPETSGADALFIGAVAARVMESIHSGQIEAATGLDDPAAYRALAALVIAGTSAPPVAIATTSVAAR